MNIRAFWMLGMVLGVVSVSRAQIDIGTTDASDGDMSIDGQNTNIDLSQASAGSWNMPSPVPGKGVYDPSKWVVVFKVNNLTITRGTTIYGHPSGCPVMYLVQGNVTLNGSVHVTQAVGGGQPGYGTLSGPGSAGFGIGGGQSTVAFDRSPGSGSYAAQGSGGGNPFPYGDVYGNPGIIPLVGGSGGGAYYSDTGGWGGGAILIACRNKITLNSAAIFANGLNGGGNHAAPGSGGAIRLVCNEIAGNGGSALYAIGGTSGNAMVAGPGRIRIEANSVGAWGQATPAPSIVPAGQAPLVVPRNTDPKVTVFSINGQAAPSEPGTPFQTMDIRLSAQGNLVVQVATLNVPIDGSWAVTARAFPQSGLATDYACSFFSGTQAAAVWQATVPFGEGYKVVQARARKL